MSAENAEKSIIATLHPLERAVLPHIVEGCTYRELTEKTGMQEVQVMRALQWLENKKVVTLEHKNTSTLLLDVNGKEAVKNGLPEKIFLRALEKEPLTIPELIKKTGLSGPEINACIGLLKKNGRIGMQEKISATKIGLDWLAKESFEEQLLAKIAAGPVSPETLEPQEQYAYDALKKRKSMLTVSTVKDRVVHITELGQGVQKNAGDAGSYADRITPEDLRSGDWKEKEYRAYDVTINVPAAVPGKPHFVNEAIAYIKDVWLELGFQEMTGTMVQTAFWCLDSLFVPQDHPAREMQDTFYLEKPASASVEQSIFDRVKAVHETGGDTGSTGWQYTFSQEETEKLLLRTHTTVLSAQTLQMISLGEKPLPGKFFAVSTNYRNEALDWKHLFEFHQVEGIVVDPNATFSHLLGYLELFFKKIGYEKIRVRPGHFPYTEPSVEVDGWHPQKKQWVELGGAGLFRPEVTKTLIGKEVPVLAWGLGMERSISEYFGITDIRELYNNDIKLLRTTKKWVK